MKSTIKLSRPSISTSPSSARTGSTLQDSPGFPIPEGYSLDDGLALVNRIVRLMNGRIPEYLDRDEVVSQGTLGLISACRSYRNDRGAAFETYATIRIRGAILDWLRRIDRLSRQRRNQYRKMQEAVTRLEEALGRSPSDEEVASKLGMTPTAFRKLKVHLQPASIVSLDSLSGEEGLPFHEKIEDTHQPKAHEDLEQREMKELLAKRIQMLPEREQKILSLYYFQRMSFAEIAKALGYCESRVCQLHSRALEKLRSFLSRVSQGESIAV